ARRPAGPRCRVEAGARAGGVRSCARHYARASDAPCTAPGGTARGGWPRHRATWRPAHGRLPSSGVSSPRRAALPAAVLVVALALVGCGSDQTDRHAPTDSPGPAPADATRPSSASAGIEGPAPTIPAEACHSPLDELTQRERIAQLFTVGVSSMEDARRAVHEHRIGGIFLGGDVVGEVVA